MKNYYNLLLVIVLALYMPFCVLSTVKADADLNSVASGDISYNNTVIGHYESYNYVADAQTNQIYVDVEGLNTLSYTGGSLHVIGFEQKYSGTLSITLDNMNYSNVVLVQGDDIGAYNLKWNDKKVLVDLVGCSSLKIYSFSTASSLSNRTTAITGYDVSNITLTDDPAMKADYMIPVESLTAYAFTTTNPEILYEDGAIYPYIEVSSGEYGRLTSWNYFNGTMSYVFMASDNLAQSSLGMRYGRVEYSMSSVSQYSFSGGYRIYHVKIGASSGSLTSVNDQLRWSIDTKIYPIYFGSSSLMPENIKRLCGLITIDMNIDRNVDSIQSYIALIYDLLNQGQSTEDEDFISDMGDVIGGYSDSEVVIHDFFDDSMGDIDLTDYSIPASLASTTAWLIDQMELVFYNVPDLRILMTLPLVLGIALFFIGRGSVIFRQGNIDRARMIANSDRISAEFAKDKINEDRVAGLNAVRENNEYRMGHHHTGHLSYHYKALREFERTDK